MEYLQTTGDRLHDLELDRILARLAALEAQSAAANTNRSTPTPVSATFPAPTVAVRTITPAGGTPMQDDLTLAAAGPISLTQSAQTLTLTVSVSPATSVTAVGSTGVVGTATTFAREDHVHAGVHKITGSTDALGDLVFTGVGVSQSGNTFTFSGGGSGMPADILVFSPGGSALNWAVPASLTEFNASILLRSQYDLTHAAQARILLFLPLPNIALMAGSVPTLAAQYSTNGGASWRYLDGSSGPALLYSAGAVISSWVSLEAGAKTDVLLRVVASGGDGTTSIPFGTLLVQAQ